MAPSLAITYIGGPTALLEFGGVKLLTDPTFDPGGGEYKSSATTLRKLAGPSLTPKELGPFDYVLLSHDHHFDNLDYEGRAQLANAKKVFTTAEGAQRIGGNSIGLQDWEPADISTPGGTLRIVATPARHGPEGLHRGAVNGFVVFLKDASDYAIYISGDSVWYPGMAEVANRFPVRVAILHLGAARAPEVGPFHLTMTSEEGVEAARHFAHATVVPIYFEDWAHFSEGRDRIAAAFAGARLEHRLQWLDRGRTIVIADIPAPKKSN
ncbi:MAG TPA: MBL fold metallo-hydrolase [Terriglobales bacterium]|nr:MBL fold metallo-hydrolase [Terriglobales bacterium]